MKDLALLNFFADDKNIITYRKSLNAITGGVLATLLLGQIVYWYKQNGNGFYKFKTPSENNPFYKEGDSWCEELGFSLYELDGALKKLKEAGLIDWKSLPDRRTIWSLNTDILLSKLTDLFTQMENSDLRKCEARNLKKPSYVNGKNQVTQLEKTNLPTITETTTETTAENLVREGFSKPRTSQKTNEALKTEIINTSTSSFGLKRETGFANLSSDYVTRLRLFIEGKRKECPHFMSADEFFNALCCKNYKYLNFAMAYIRWNAKNTNTPQRPNPHGLSQGALNTMENFKALAQDLRDNGQGEMVGDAI